MVAAGKTPDQPIVALCIFHSLSLPFRILYLKTINRRNGGFRLETKSALILGGGIIGLTCAHTLQQRAYAITVVDPYDQPPSASFGNAGHLAVEQAAPLASPQSLMGAPGRLFALGGPLDFPLANAANWGPFAHRFIAASTPTQFASGKAALTAWLEEAIPAWRRLVAAIGAEDLLLENGHFVVWESEKSAAKGAAAWKKMNTPASAFRLASDTEIAEIAGRVRAPIAGAIRFERSGQILDLQELHRRLRRAVEKAGGAFIRARVERVEIEDGKAKAVSGGGANLGANVVLVSAGVASGPLMKSAGCRAPLIAERGYHIETSADGWPPLPPVVFEDRSLIVTRFANAVRLAGFVEFARPDAAPDPRKWRRLRQHADELGIRLDESVTQWMGARPTLPDYLPAIGKSARADNLFYAFGHQHLGLTLAGVTAEAVAHLVSGQAPELD
ncbi:MAG: FAD-binding oxidoreductase, partial [Amphiplicatus sp.]